MKSKFLYKKKRSFSPKKLMKLKLILALMANVIAARDTVQEENIITVYPVIALCVYINFFYPNKLCLNFLWR